MEKKAPFNVFVSSTYRDLRNEREKVIEAVEKVCKAIGMEKFLPDEKSTLEVCLEHLRKCDIYIGIVGSRYGSIVPENQLKKVEGENYEKYKGLSFTHYEFRKAGELGIPRAVFIINEESEDDKVIEFKKEIEDSLFPSYFSNLDELSEKVESFLREKIPEWVFDGRLKIPGFYGREEELLELYEKITGEKQICSVVNVFGVGGIGKTAFVEALLLLLSIKGYPVWEVRSTEGRETTFYTPENYKTSVLEFPNIRGLVQLLGIEAKRNVEDSLISWLDDNKAVLFIDDFQKLENNFKDFINKAYNKLENGKIIVASRGRPNVSWHFSKELLRLEEEPCKEMIRSKLKNASLEPKEEIEVVYEKTKGHPLAVKMLVPLISRYKLSVDKLKEFGSIKNVQDEDEVRGFISRVFIENVKDERDRKVLKYLSLLKNGFDYDILKAILKKFNDKRWKWDNEKLLREFLSQYMPHIISSPIGEKILNFSHDMVKEVAYSQVENVEEAREKILEILREMEKKLLDEKKAFVNEEILYQAEELVKCKGENEELVKVAFESSCMLAEYGYHNIHNPLMTYEYGKKALHYSEKLEAWIEALFMADHMLNYAYDLLIPEEEARTLYNKVNEVFPKALKSNEDKAKNCYAFAMEYWAFYALHLLNNPEEAVSSLEKAFKEVGSKDSRLIKDELMWYDAYSAILTVKSDLLRRKGDLKGALRVLEEREELLEHYKDKIINRWGEKGYYDDKSVIMSKLGGLMFDVAESEDDLERVREYVKNCIIYALKAENRLNAATSRTNLAVFQIMLAKNQDDFKKVYEKVEGISLEDCIKIFEEIGDKHREVSAKFCMAIYCLALKRDDDALKFAEDSIEIVKKGPDEYLKACYELTLAYIKMTSGLSDLKKKELSDEVYGLIQNAYEKLRKIRQTSQFIVLAVEVVAKYLGNEKSFDELLKELDELVEKLENVDYKRRAWIMKQFRESIKKKGDVDEDLLRLEGVKLLLAL